MEDVAAIDAPASASLAAVGASASVMDPSAAINRLRTMRFQEDSPDYRCVDYLACSAPAAAAASAGETMLLPATPSESPSTHHVDSRCSTGPRRLSTFATSPERPS